MSYTDKEGNRISLDEYGFICITPKNESSNFYDLSEIIKALKIYEKINRGDDKWHK